MNGASHKKKKKLAYCNWMSQLFSLTTNGCHKQIKTDTIACGLQGQQLKIQGNSTGTVLQCCEMFIQCRCITHNTPQQSI